MSLEKEILNTMAVNSGKDRLLSIVPAGFLMGILAFSSSSLVMADEPVAIVDDIVGEMEEVQIMDLLWAGQSLTLGDNVQISIGYMDTCRSEKITGGNIIIGTEKSTVDGGEIEAKQLDCGQKIQGKFEGGKTVALTAVFRNSNAQNTPKLDRTIYSLYPAVIAKEGGQVVVIRLDKKNAKPLELSLENGRIDFHSLNLPLSSGGVYRISVGQGNQVIKISPRAKAQNLSFIQRLVKF
jgi:hypothetical protein